MIYDPAEKQMLAMLDLAQQKGLATDAASLAPEQKWFWVFMEDREATINQLRDRGLVSGADDALRLTDKGMSLGRMFHRDSVALYHDYYQKFYPAAFDSPTHTRFCNRVFGKDLCQDGQVDMAGLHNMLDRMNIDPGQRVLDVGCGAGAITAFIAEMTGAHATGLDLADTAISAAQVRHAEQGERLEFVQGDIDKIGFADHSFDAVVSIDSLYWVTDLTDALSKLIQILRPGGQLGIFMEQDCQDRSPDVLKAPNTDLSKALDALSLDRDVMDYSLESQVFWRRIRDTVLELRDDYEAEGNGFIAESLTRQAIEFLPEIEEGLLTRYFYHVRL